MADLIDRQVAIDAVRHSPIIEVQPAYMLIDKADVLKNIVMLPSAQPDVPDRNVGDMIDRQAAIDAIEDLQDCYNGFSDTYDKACIIGVLEEVPSAQPDTSRIENILHGKSAEEQYDFLWWLMQDYGIRFTDTRSAVIEWLKGERNG